MKRDHIRILAVSPRFAPSNGADTHRLRLLLRHAQSSGWQVEVLAVDPAHVAEPLDPWLDEQVPPEVPVHRVGAWKLRGWGLGGLAQRSLWSLWKKGCDLLSTRRFDLVFFSTTEFALHVLGPLWDRRYGIPFCMDYQDPWVNDYYRTNPAIVPPGGRLKYAVADAVHRVLERSTVRRCAGFMAVSEAYLADLRHRYGAEVSGKPMLVRPFPAEPAELETLRARTRAAEDRCSAPKLWRYIGRGGPDMVKAASAFFAAWQCAIADGIISGDAVRLEADGTSYAEMGRGEKTFEPLVAGTRLAAQVRENPDRLGYKDMLHALLDSDALVVFGSDDRAYTASKVYPYLLARKPLLAVLHECSSVVALLRAVGGAVCVTFNDRTTEHELADSINQAWFASGYFGVTRTLDANLLAPFTASAQAKDVAAWFGEVLKAAGERELRNEGP